MKKSNKKGFTIVELVVVIAIIAVLAAVLIPTFASLINKANESAYQQDRTNQMIQDAVEKIDKGEGYMSWEDLEKAIAEALKENAISADKIIEIVGVGKDTGLTDEQLTKILEAIANKKFSDTQVKVILEGVQSGNASLTKEQIDQIIAKLPQVGITQEDIAAAVKEVLGETDTVAEQINQAIAAALNNAVLSEEGIAAIVEQILKSSTIDKVPGAYIYNITIDKYYEDLYTALSEISDSKSNTLVLLKDLAGVSNKNYQIAENQIIVFDLNGHTMNTVAPDDNTAYAIENKGTLTIKDNTDTLKNGTGKGKLELNALNPDLQSIPGYASNLITNMGNLTIDSGWLYNASTGTAAYAIDLNSNNGRNVSLVINGGKITTNGSLSIRQQVHTNTTNDVTINGGIVGSYWIQNYGNSSTSANGNLNINAGEFLYKIRLDTGYSIDHGYDIKAENVHVNINGGTFNGTITVYEDGNNGQFTISGGTFNKEITYYGEVKFIRGGTFNVSPELKSDGYPYAVKDGGGFGFYNLTNLLNEAGTTLDGILQLDLETQISTYGFGLEYWEAPSIANKTYGGSDCYDVVRYVTPSYDEDIIDGYVAVNNGDGTITVVAA